MEEGPAPHPVAEASAESSLRAAAGTEEPSGAELAPSAGDASLIDAAPVSEAGVGGPTAGPSLAPTAPPTPGKGEVPPSDVDGERSRGEHAAAAPSADAQAADAPKEKTVPVTPLASDPAAASAPSAATSGTPTVDVRDGGSAGASSPAPPRPPPPVPAHAPTSPSSPLARPPSRAPANRTLHFDDGMGGAAATRGGDGVMPQRRSPQPSRSVGASPLHAPGSGHAVERRPKGKKALKTRRRAVSALGMHPSDAGKTVRPPRGTGRTPSPPARHRPRVRSETPDGMGRRGGAAGRTGAAAAAGPPGPEGSASDPEVVFAAWRARKFAEQRASEARQAAAVEQKRAERAWEAELLARRAAASFESWKTMKVAHDAAEARRREANDRKILAASRASLLMPSHVLEWLSSREAGWCD